MRASAPLFLALILAGCRTTETTHHFAGSGEARVRAGARSRTWEVRCGDELAGRIVLFQEQGSVRDSVYIVRNAWHQDLGLIDGLGRAFRYLPHHREPAWVGSGTVVQGAERILGTSSACRLIEVVESAATSVDPAAQAGATTVPEAPCAGPPEVAAEGGFPQSR